MKWKDDLQCTTGTTHVRVLDDTFYGLCAEIKEKGNTYLTAYRVEGDKRIVIGRVPTPQRSYQHCFGISKDYFLIFDHPFYFNLMEEIKGSTVMEVIQFDKDATTKIHAIKISDGSIT